VRQMFTGLGGGKQKGKKGGKGGGVKKEAKEPTLSHSLDTLTSYTLLKLKPPSVKVCHPLQPRQCVSVVESAARGLSDVGADAKKQTVCSIK
jgi:hypothetical protein